jgi:hypothetical protein
LVAFIHFRDWAGTRRAENFDCLRGQPDSDQAIRFVALAKEQLALVTDDRLHWIPFVDGLKKGSSRLAMLLPLPAISRVLGF